MSTVDNNEYIQMFQTSSTKSAIGSMGASQVFTVLIDEYVPESQEIDYEEIKKSEHFKRKKYLDALYFGELIENKR